MFRLGFRAGPARQKAALPGPRRAGPSLPFDCAQGAALRAPAFQKRGPELLVQEDGGHLAGGPRVGWDTDRAIQYAAARCTA